MLEPGLLTTVQDRGRPGYVHLGVPVGGACDPMSLAVANALLGNDGAAAALEMTLAGATLLALEDCDVAVAGADFEATVDGVGGFLSPGSGIRLRRGQTVAFGTPREGTGIRAYLAMAGGIDVPVVLGSRSTCLVGGFGGLDGRPLRAGDRIRGVGPSDSAPDRSSRVGPTAGGRPARLRVVAGPHLDRFAPDALALLESAEYTVGGHSDRQGIRIEGPALSLTDGAGSMLSQGVTWGAIQVPPDGRPICLLADHQTVGGYPVVAVVATIDRPALGQLGPGDSLRFELIDIEEAQRLWREAAAALPGGTAGAGV